MELNFADTLKALRNRKNVSQEKLAQYLNVSFQAVSKWERAVCYPDITLLPDLARFFGITIDELLCVEKWDENKRFEECSEKASAFFRDGKREEALAVWQEAYRQMPNNIDVKEILMSSYFDTDIDKYFQEFVELATEIYNSDDEGRAWNMYYKGQAISQLARCYAARGDTKTAQQWAYKSIPLFNACEIISAQIDNGEDLRTDVAFCTYWFLEELFYMAARIDNDKEMQSGNDYRQACLTVVAKLFETVYPEDDMGFEQLQHLYNLHQGIAAREAAGDKKEEIVRRHLERAMDCCEKSVSVKEHRLTHPMLYGLQVAAAPQDSTMLMRGMRETLAEKVYDDYRSCAWFQKLGSRVTGK